MKLRLCTCLIEEDDAGRAKRRLLKNAAQHRLALAKVLAKDITCRYLEIAL